MTKQDILNELDALSARLSPCNHRTNSEYTSEVLEVQRELIMLEQRIETSIKFDELAENAFALRNVSPEAYEKVLADFANES